MNLNAVSVLAESLSRNALETRENGEAREGTSSHWLHTTDSRGGVQQLCHAGTGFSLEPTYSRRMFHQIKLLLRPGVASHLYESRNPT